MGLIDAEQADHAGVVGGGPQEDAGSREADHGEGEDADREPDSGDGKRIDRQVVGAEPDRAGELARHRRRHHMHAPDELDDVANDQHHGDGHEELKEHFRAIDPAQQKDFAQRADDHHHGAGGDHAGEQAADAGRRDEGIDVVAEERAQHEERAVGEVDDSADAEDQGQARRHEEQHGALHEAVQKLRGDHRRELRLRPVAGGPTGLCMGTRIRIHPAAPGTPLARRPGRRPVAARMGPGGVTP